MINLNNPGTKYENMQFLSKGYHNLFSMVDGEESYESHQMSYLTLQTVFQKKKQAEQKHVISSIFLNLFMT